MPRSRPDRSLLPRVLAALVLLVTVAGFAPPATLAAEPYRPLPGYQPAFVTQADGPPPFQDCLWASASMLLDKLTSGQLLVGRRELRRLSGDRVGGSTFVDLSRTWSRLGLELRYSPDGGDIVTWRSLLDRLEKGGGAILLGDYGRLPRRYGRWDVAFWEKDGADDNHAIYLDRFDRRRNRVWVMDPLGRGSWQGEWVPVSALRQYAWRGRGGALWAVVTPPAEAAPFAGVSLGTATARLAEGRLEVDWPLDETREGWTYPGADVRTDVVRLDSGIVPAVPGAVFVVGQDDATLEPRGAPLPVAPAAGAGSLGAPVPAGLFEEGPTLGVGDVQPAARPIPPVNTSAVRATAPLPTEPGTYQVRLRLTERRFGQTVASAGPYVVFVPGKRRAELRAEAGLPEASAGTAVGVAVHVTNTGTSSWRELPAMAGLPAGAVVPRATALVAHWVPAESTAGEAGEPLVDATGAPDDGSLAPGEDGLPTDPAGPVTVAALPLDAGETTLLWITLAAPTQPGTWHLVLDVADQVDGSLAAAGSPPATIVVTVTPGPIRE